MTYNDWLMNTTKELQAVSHSPRLDADILLGLVTGQSKAHLLAYIDTPLTLQEQGALQRKIERRMAGEPMAYISGTIEFYGHDFMVNEKVLVPRPESESFLELLHELRKTQRVHNLVDIGTGSGVLAISAKLAHPDLYITATDVSNSALSVAAENSLQHKAPITLRNQSLLTGDKEGYDVLFANLPYVPTNPVPDPSIAHEPPSALFSGSDGLDHYRKLFKQLAPKHIRFVMVESLANQHTAVQALAQAADYTLCDSAGLVQLFTKNGDTTDRKSVV